MVQEAHARGATDRAVAAPEQERRSDMMCDKNTDADKCVGRPQVSTAHKSYIHVNKLLAHKSYTHVNKLLTLLQYPKLRC